MVDVAENDELAEFRALLTQTRELHSRFQELRTLPEACAAYQLLLSDEIKRVTQLTTALAELHARRAVSSIKEDAQSLPPLIGPGQESKPHSPGSTNQYRDTGRGSQNPAAVSEARRQLKKLINRWAYVWRLEDT